MSLAEDTLGATGTEDVGFDLPRAARGQLGGEAASTACGAWRAIFLGPLETPALTQVSSVPKGTESHTEETLLAGGGGHA